MEKQNVLLTIKDSDIVVGMKLTQSTETKKELAIFTVSLGPIKVKGFRIRPSEHSNKHGENLWIVPPSYRSKKGTYHPIFFSEDKALWEIIEEKIYEEYNRLLMESTFENKKVDTQETPEIDF